MLAIDPERNVTSIRPDWALFPYVVKDFEGRPWAAALYLASRADSTKLIVALSKEIIALGAPGTPALQNGTVLTNGVRLASRGVIMVGEYLPHTVKLVFQPDNPTERDLNLAVRFARPDIAKAFMHSLHDSVAAKTAFGAALAHHAGEQRKPPPNADDHTSWIASELMLRQLGLFPVNGDPGILRVAWIEHRPLGSPDPGGSKDPGAPSARAPIAPAKPQFFDLKIIIYGDDNKPVSGADWAVTGFKGQTGKTGGDGAIMFTDIGEARTASLKVTLPPLPKLVPAPPADAAPASPPPYPRPVVASEFKEPEGKAKGPNRQHVWALSVVDVEDMQLATGDQLTTANEWRLRNFGFRWGDSSTEAVKAYQRWNMGKHFAGSGVLADIAGDLKSRHDNG